MKPSRKKAGGRPLTFQPIFTEQAHAHCLLGATDEDLAGHFGVALSTLYQWKKRFPEFAEAIKAGKRPADAQIATALFDRAKGAEWVEEQAFKLKRVEYDDKGKRVLEDERLEVVEVTRRAPPDTTAGIFWLKNRKTDDWKDRKDVDVTSKGEKVSGVVILPSVGDET